MGYTEHNPVHEISTEDDGTTISRVEKIGATHFMSPNGGRLPAFAGLAKATGGYLAENPAGMSLERALDAADLNYTVTKETITSQLIGPDGVTTVEYPGTFGAVAQWPDGRVSGLGAVGEIMKFAQPRQAGELGQQIIETGGANCVAAGMYGHPVGARNYMAFMLPEDIEIGGVDRYNLYLTILNCHNGKGALTGLLAPIRFWCTNQTEMTFGDIGNRFTFRHSGDIDAKVTDARKALGIAATWSQRFQQRAEKLLATPMSNTQVDGFVADLLPTPKDISTKTGEKNWANRRYSLKNVIRESDTNEFGRGTAYAAYNGVVEWVDFVRAVRHGKHTPAEQRRYARTLDGGVSAELKTEAARLLGAYAR